MVAGAGIALFRKLHPARTCPFTRTFMSIRNIRGRRAATWIWSILPFRRRSIDTHVTPLLVESSEGGVCSRRL